MKLSERCSLFTGDGFQYRTYYASEICMYLFTTGNLDGYASLQL